MPELPEVETVARSLVSGQGLGLNVIGRRFAHARVRWPRSIAVPGARSFGQQLAGRQVTGVGRRGKFIRIDLSQGGLLVHLRMSGDLLLGRGEQPLGRFARVQMFFDDGVQLSFDDARKFGRIWLLDDPEVVLGALGPEPFDPALTPARFHRMLAERNRQLKPLLLDQAFIAGLGNIYADEALWTAQLHPLQASQSVDKAAAGRLLRAIRKVLTEGIKRNGASIDWVYRGGEFQNYFKAYQQTGEPCPRCGTPISRIVVGQRSTHYCPNCQRL
ncbi:MAG: bifunctional DNA-formamidopyrimidine glycosylase/DNA-(apurinic or apyrimidinic site) lyase [Anaerolineales bacterium]|nr:MAG: bifunctional DNA-formamidopyrimidine glycosylase/DNA-(apurinic or apyrimidinic site) lyase [Anaerolineales bacterium]